MSLNFPSKPDIQLENPPLVEVVCQVRFPPILRIASEEPSEFQERIRDQFPNVELEHGFLVRVPGPGAMGTPTAEPQTRTYRFRTPDAQTAISLAVDFYALSSNRYSHWEEFAKYLRSTHEAIQHVYKPTYSMRIGLRRLFLWRKFSLEFVSPEMSLRSRVVVCWICLWVIQGPQLGGRAYKHHRSRAAPQRTILCRKPTRRLFVRHLPK